MAVTAAEINNYIGFTTQKKEPSQNMDKEAFLKLLVAQLQNQDPSQSQDPQAMVQQMTAFSQLEQLQNVGEQLKVMQSQNVALFQASATTLVGKYVRVQGAGVELKEGVAKIGIDLSADAQVKMVIKDDSGRTITTIDKGSFKAGHHEFEWDGKTSEGLQLDDSVYRIDLIATNEEGNRVDALCVSDLRVDSVAFADGTVLVVAGGKYYSLGDIIEVRA